MADNKYIVCGSEPINTGGFVRRHFKTNSQDNIGCYLKVRDSPDNDALKQLLEQDFLDPFLNELC